MKKKYICIVLLAFGFLVSNAAAQSFDNVGTSAANFLKIGVGSRAQAMAGAFVAQANDVTSLYWNVAGITGVETSEVGISANDWISDITHYFLGGVFPFGEFGKIGVEVIYLNAGTMRKTTWEDPAGLGGQTFNANNFSFGLAYARDLTDRFSFGVKGKFIREQISFSYAQGFAVDFGTLYKTGFRGMKIGMSINNFGSKLKMEGSDLRRKIDPYPTEGSNPDDVWANMETERWAMPLTIRIGLSMDVLDFGTNKLTMNFDFRDDRDYKELYIIGGEYAMFNNMLFLRGGISDRFDDDWRFNMGAGLQYKISDIGFCFDYSYSDLGVLEQANRYSVRIMF